MIIMAKAIYEGVSGVARKVKNAYEGIGGVARKIKAGWIGVGSVARQFYSGQYATFYEAYQNGAITSLVTAWGWDKDDGETWSQYSYVSAFTPSSENTFNNSGTLASQSSSKYTSTGIIRSALYIFCPTLEDTIMVAEMIKTKYTSVKGYDTYRQKYFNMVTTTSFEASDITYSTDICANTGLSIGYWGRYGVPTDSWNASTASGYSDKYYVCIDAGYFVDDWDSDGDYARNLDQIIFE